MIDSRNDLHDAQPGLSDAEASDDMETGHGALAGRSSTRRASQSGGEPGRGTAAEGSLTFPDLPRLELDQLLGQLVDRAQEVLVTQGRLRGLLRSTQVVTGHLALPVVLQRIVAAARDLVGARYAALGVIAPDGGLSEFVHVGMPDDAVEAIGHLPHGKGLLGALIDDPHPIRLRRIGEDPRSSGFPAGHPPMTSFLGVPIRIRDDVFGNLYLADSARGEFSAEDEELTLALAATAAAAIDRARLYQAAHARGEWLQATAAITQRLLSTEPGGPGGHDGPLQLIAERTREIAQADLVTVVLPAGEDLRVEVAVGPAAAGLCGRTVPVAGSLAGRVFTTGQPLRVAQAHELPGLAPMTTDNLDVGPVLVLPLHGSQRQHGVLTAARVRGRPSFTADDVDMAAGFANQAAVAIELAEARAEQQRTAMLEDRQRIAADLHDHVIQRLFAAGLSLQALAAFVGPGQATDRILATVADLDRTIAQIRTSIFQLQATQATPRGLRARLLEVAAEQADTLGFDPALRFSGVLDALPDGLAEDLEAVLREALSNIARHAHARTVQVDLTATPGQVSLQISDDGIGLGPTTRRSGLTNLRRRAERHGGALTLTPRQPTGTRLCWSIPDS
jgi:two-component system, NarL family, sensor histidine kinase DevS